MDFFKINFKKIIQNFQIMKKNIFFMNSEVKQISKLRIFYGENRNQPALTGIERTAYHRHSLPHIPRQKLLTFSEAEDEDKGKEAAKGGIHVRLVVYWSERKRNSRLQRIQ